MLITMRRLVLFGIISPIIMMCYYYLIARDIKGSPLERTHDLNLSQFYSSVPHTIKTILILSNKDWVLHKLVENSSYFERRHCPETSCIITKDRTYLPDYSDYDAIVFLWQIQWDSPEYFEKKRADQIFVVAAIESPFLIEPLEDENKDLIVDYTMTYRLDSDISWYYAAFHDINTHQIIAPLVNGTPQWRSIEEKHFDRPFFKHEPFNKLIYGKTETAAWFVSNCIPSSDRMKIAISLQKFINVDIYGACGNFSCPRSNESACAEMLEQKYFFYLSFENAICRDYITEKVFRTMNYNIVPVVFGGADYSKFLPPHSYINTNDFPTTKLLADYLKFLMDNPEEYKKYFWWKEFYYVDLHRTYCNLCAKLHEQPKKGKGWRLKEVDNWYRNNSCTDKYAIKLS